MALNDSEVQKQIQHMVAFIQQEAQEKANEISVKAEEEFNIEKGRLVQQEKLKIMGQYERKEKQIEIKRRIAYSNELNAARLKVLKARDAHVQRVLERTRADLVTISRDPARYSILLEGLIAQGLYQLLEPEVVVKCRKEDVDIVRKAVARAAASFARDAGRHCTVKVSEHAFLLDTCAGGVELTSPSAHVMVVNTLESRLELVAQMMLPEIREILFGASSRRFRD